MIETALQKDPARRFGSVRELQQAFQAAVLGRSPGVASENVRVVVEEARPVTAAGRAPVDRLSELEQTVVDRDDSPSLWWPTRRAFYWMLGTGTVLMVVGEGRRDDGIAVALMGAGSAYILYTLARRIPAEWAARILRFFDRSSPTLGADGNWKWGLVVAAWLFFVLPPLAHTTPESLNVVIPIGMVLAVLGAAAHLLLPQLVQVRSWSAPYAEGTVPPSPHVVRRASAPAPVRPNHHRHAQPQATKRYYRQRAASPSMARALSWRTRMVHYSTAATLVVPIVALLAGSVAVISPRFFAAGTGGVLALENVGLFTCTAVIASWMLLGLSKWNEGRRLDGATRRLLQMAGGAAVGLIGFWLSEVLLISPTPPTETLAGTLWAQPGDAAFVALADRPLFFEGGRPTLLGFVVFFAALFGLRRWWWQSDAFRPKRFRISSVLLTVLLAWVVGSVWAFPRVWAMTWAAVISSAVQLAAPWTPPEERIAVREV